jgi:hypothetical protein
MRFLGDPFEQADSDGFWNILETIELAKAFMIEAKISHFEMSYGFKPRLSHERMLPGGKSGGESCISHNMLYLELQRELLHVLRSHANTTLKSLC